MRRKRLAAVAAGIAVVASGVFVGQHLSRDPETKVLPGRFTPTPLPSESVTPTPDPTGTSTQLPQVSQILCTLAKTDTFDTIVAPGVNPFGHEHDFLGNRTITEDSTYETLIGQETSCEADEPKDTAVYWVPGLLVNGVRTYPNPGVRVYYTRPDNGLASPSAKKEFPIDKPFPPDFRMIAGDGGATTVSQNRAFVAGRVNWFCYPVKHSQGTNSPPPTDCSTSGGHRMDIYLTFPSCWVGSAARPGDVISTRPGYEGQVIDSADHKSHVAYPALKTGECPSTHPVRLPQVKFQVIYRGYDGTTSFTSGPWASWHGDFLNSWDQERLEAILAGL